MQWGAGGAPAAAGHTPSGGGLGGAARLGLAKPHYVAHGGGPAREEDFAAAADALVRNEMAAMGPDRDS